MIQYCAVSIVTNTRIERLKKLYECKYCLLMGSADEYFASVDPTWSEQVSSSSN